MSTRALGAAVADIAGSSVTKLGASLFEVSPVWKSIERQTQMFDHVSKANTLMAKTTALSAPGVQLAELIAKPGIEQISASYKKLGEELARSVLPRAKLWNLEATVKSQRLVAQSWETLAATQKVGFAQSMDLMDSWEGVLRLLAELDLETEEEKLQDQDTAWVAPAQAPLLTPEERVLLVRATWILFVTAQLLTPEGRQLLDEYSVVWSLITAIVFSYGPKP